MVTFNPNTALSLYTGVIESWTVPSSGVYTLELWGAAGGNCNSVVGGKGAYVKVNVSLTAGEVLKILVPRAGQSTTGSSSGYSAGGGGGAFVWKGTSTLLAAAGGGGGAGSNAGGPGVLTTAGGNAAYSGGNGAVSAGTNGNASGNGAASGSSGIGTAAGWLQNGTPYSGWGGVAYTPTSSSFPGQGSYQGGWTGCSGGFGGAGSGAYGAGPGGGYSGGAVGGFDTSGYGAGGGGSYAINTMDGSSASGVRSGDGLVAINIANTEPTVSISSQTINPLGTSRIEWTYSDAESNAQTKYEILYKEQGSENGWTHAESTSGNAYHQFPAGTFEEGKTYDCCVRVYDGTDWSDRAFSTITAVSPHRVRSGINFIKNPSAELASAVGWGGVTGTLTRSTAKSYSGNASFMFTHPTSGNVNLNTRDIPAKPGQKFRLRGRFAAGAGVAVPRNARVDYAFERADNSRTHPYTAVADVAISTDGNWIEVIGDTVVAPAETTKLFAVFGVIGIQSGEYFHLDDLQVIDFTRGVDTGYFDGDSVDTNTTRYYWLGEPHNSPSAMEQFAIENLIPFDAEVDSYGGGGEVGGWNWSSTIMPSGGVNGGRYHRLTATAATQSAGLYINPSLYGVEPGKAYEMSYMLRSSHTGLTWNAVRAEWRKTDGTLISTTYASSAYLTANTWARIGGIMTAPPEATRVTFCMYKTSGNLPSGGTADFDLPFMAESVDGDRVNYFDGSTISANTTYQWTGTPNASTSLKATYGNWTTLTETTSATAAGVLNATALEAGDYELSIRVQDSTGAWSDWGPVESFELSPASNIQVKRAGTWTTGVEYVKKNGIWVQASPTKRKSGGVFA